MTTTAAVDAGIKLSVVCTYTEEQRRAALLRGDAPIPETRTVEVVVPQGHPDYAALLALSVLRDDGAPRLVEGRCPYATPVDYGDGYGTVVVPKLAVQDAELGREVEVILEHAGALARQPREAWERQSLKRLIAAVRGEDAYPRAWLGWAADEEWIAPELRAQAAATLAAIEAEEAASKAAAEALQVERAATKAAEEAAKVVKRAALEAWGREHGTPLLLARIEEGMTWEPLARQEWADRELDAVIGLPQAVELTESADSTDVADRTAPTLVEIETLRAARKAFEGRSVEVCLEWVTYVMGRDKVAQTELDVLGTAPDGAQVRRFYQVPGGEVRGTTSEDED